jgi:hypothetical protein
MKKLFYLFTILFAALFTACEPSEPGIPSKVETGAAENITATSATLKGMVNVDIIDYEEIVFGVLYSTKAEELATLAAPSKNGLVLVGNEFKVEVTDLTAETKYYYRAYVMLNTLQILLGEVKEFTTLPTNANPDTPEDPSAKPFSVSATKTVTFSPGNLQYHPANNEWRFAPSQLDYIGNDNANISATYNGWIDLFGWGTGNNPANNSTNNEDYPTFVDWGVNKIGNYAPNTWRTLTDAEWEYLIEERPNYDKLIAVAQINGVNGWILLPDDWTCPSGVTFKSGFDDNFDGCIECFGNNQTLSASDWAKLEAAGAVFLPAAGARVGSLVVQLQEYGYYWSATEEEDGEHANYLTIKSAEAFTNNYNRYSAESVRLVRD